MKRIFTKMTAAAVIICVVLSLVTTGVFAANNSTLQFKSPITVGQSVTVTANFYSDIDMQLLEGYLTYDPNVLEYSNGTNANTNLITKGKIKIFADNASGKSHTESFQFKALKTGSSAMALVNVVCYDINELQYSIEGASGVSVKVENPSSTASSNANLKSLSVSPGTLTPKFSKDVTSYSVTIPNDKTECLVTYAQADSKATVRVEGSKTMQVGLNKRTVIVTAENGATKSYVINITRLDAAGTVPDAPTDEPINQSKIEVFADGETMYIEENFSPDTVPAGFTTDVYDYSGTEVPCITAGAVKLFYLIMADGTGGDFYMLQQDGTFTKPQRLNVCGTDYYLFPLPEGEKLPAGYKQISLTVGEQEISCYQSEDAALSDFVLVYAMGKNGNPGLYRYDTVDGTIQRTVGMNFVYAEEEKQDEDKNQGDLMAVIKSLNTNGIIVAVTVLAVFLLLIAAMIVLIIKIATAGKTRHEEEEFPEDEEENFMPFDYVTVEDREKDE